MPTSFLPTPALRDRVQSIDVVDVKGGSHTVLPTASAVLGLQVNGRVRTDESLLSPLGVTGLLNSARQYTYLGPTRSLLVRFTPQGACCVRAPASELTNSSVGMESLLAPAFARESLEGVLEAQSLPEQVRRLEEFLLKLPFHPDPLIERALALLTPVPNEEVHVAGVARQLAMSERQLERRFKERVGTSPKRFVSLKRFERAVEIARRAESLTDAAMEAGYYDQSHFIRDFRRFAGMTPGQLLGR